VSAWCEDDEVIAERERAIVEKAWDNAVKQTMRAVVRSMNGLEKPVELPPNPYREAKKESK
jgi:hypothetical protein